MMSSKQVSLLLATALGRLTTGWQAVSGGTKDEEHFTVIRYCGTLKKGHLRRIEGDRV